MNRKTEVEILAATLESPVKTLVAAAIEAHDLGNLSASAQIMADLNKKNSNLRWVTLLLALDAAELKLGGSVSFATPDTRFSADTTSPTFTERWGKISCTVWSPNPDVIVLEIVPTTTKGLTVVVSPTVSSRLPACVEAVAVLAKEFGAHFGVKVNTLFSRKTK